MKILGIDPAMRNFGLARGVLTGGVLDVQKIGLIETATGKGLKQVRKNSDDLRRCRDLYNGLLPYVEWAEVVFCEVPVGSQSARAMASYGMCLGILASIKKPLVQLSPIEVKMASVGNKNATKREMIDWASELYPNLPWIKGRGQLGDKNEHIADAIATIHAGIMTDEFRMAEQMAA
jgi:Holliday junction resolvasome RuvABC endonuclease subunit